MDKEEQSVYGNGLISPLWSNADFYTLYGYDIKKEKYIKFDIEDGVDRTNFSSFIITRSPCLIPLSCSVCKY